MSSHQTSDPPFVFALDIFSPVYNYVPPWFALLLGRNSQQLRRLRLPLFFDLLPGMPHRKCTASLVDAFSCPGHQQDQGHFKNLPWRVRYESYLFSQLRCGNKIHRSIYFSQWQSSGLFRNSLPCSNWPSLGACQVALIPLRLWLVDFICLS